MISDLVERQFIGRNWNSKRQSGELRRDLCLTGQTRQIFCVAWNETLTAERDTLAEY